ncbi:MAG: deoxyribose-phosphate aldolase [Frankia sp.]
MTTVPAGGGRSDAEGGGAPDDRAGDAGIEWSRADVASVIDHTLLRPETTADEIVALCDEASRLKVKAVCVSPTHVYLAAAAARRNGGTGGEPAYQVASVVGFPSGNHLTVIKAEEARRAVADGADEIDMVIDPANAMDENWQAMETEISEIRLSIPPHVILKVILETALLPDGNIASACRAAEAAGAEFVKTSTGCRPAGGASLRAVRVMVETVGGRLGIKASGGIRTTAQALAYLDAGATRLGLSASATILAGLPT